MQRQGVSVDEVGVIGGGASFLWAVASPAPGKLMGAVGEKTIIHLENK